MDLLHTLYLGPMQGLAKHILWFLLMANIFKLADTSEENLVTAILLLRGEMFDWYTKWESEHPSDQVTKMGDLTLKMIGRTAATSKLKLKAMETFWFLRFLLDLLQRYLNQLPPVAERLMEAGHCLCEYINLLRNCGTNVPVETARSVHRCWLRFRTLSRVVPEVEGPKLHLMLHVAHRIAMQGNPWHTATWLDETLNKMLKQTLRNCHQATFESQGFAKMTHNLQKAAKRRRLR